MMSRKDLQGSGPAYKRSEALGDWRMVPGSEDAQLIDIPMAETAYDSVKNAPVNRDSTYGIRGKPANLGVNEESNISEARRYDSEGYEMDGLRIATCRTNRTKFTGRK